MSIIHPKKRCQRKKNASKSKTFQTGYKKQIFDATCLLSSLYITYTLDGFLFNLDQSNIYRDIQKIEPLIKQCLPIPQKIYKITKKSLKTPPDEIEKYFPGFLLSFIDCTEQQIPRPIDNTKRKIFYSGKKKRHTAVKNQLMTNNHGIIIHKTNHKIGCRPDYNIYKNHHPATPKQVVSVFDLGYQYRKGFSKTTISTTL